MNKSEEKKIQLMLKDFLMNHEDYSISPVYLGIYDNCDETFQKVFSYFHENLNSLFEFMNNKSSVNSHYNADESRGLINIINELREVKSGLKNTDYDFEINNSYIEQFKYVQTFLKQSGGSPIPEDYEKFTIIKYEHIFYLKNKNTLLETGHYFNAVEESYKIVREKLKSITGKEKAHEAFNENNYSTIFGHESKDDVEKDFFEGVKFLHMAIQKLRNEKAHTPAREMDKKLAIHYIVLASLAYDLISRN
jgi:uncharacterized protein (TIGR02391 family)